MLHPRRSIRGGWSITCMYSFILLPPAQFLPPFPFHPSFWSSPVHVLYFESAYKMWPGCLMIIPFGVQISQLYQQVYQQWHVFWAEISIEQGQRWLCLGYHLSGGLSRPAGHQYTVIERWFRSVSSQAAPAAIQNGANDIKMLYWEWR